MIKISKEEQQYLCLFSLTESDKNMQKTTDLPVSPVLGWLGCREGITMCMGRPAGFVFRFKVLPAAEDSSGAVLATRLITPGLPAGRVKVAGLMMGLARPEPLEVTLELVDTIELDVILGRMLGGS